MTQFQPSRFSYSTPYGGVLDWFGKEERAERKEARAEKYKKRGWDRGAARLEMRAGNLKHKASGKKKLSQKSETRELWSDPYPWSARPGTKGRGILYATLGRGHIEKLTQAISKGTKPPAAFRKREWRSTILGGLQALQSAGVSGYAEMNLDNLAVPVSPSKKADPALIAATGKTSLQEASEFIRAEVSKHGLEVPAWNYRGIIMIQPAILSAKNEAAGASVAAGLMVATGPWALIPAAIAAQESAHLAILENDVAKFEQDAAVGLEAAGVNNALAEVKAQTRALQLETEEIAAQSRAEVEAQGQATAKKIKVIAGVSTVALLGGLLLWAVNRRAKEEA